MAASWLMEALLDTEFYMRTSPRYIMFHADVKEGHTKRSNQMKNEIFKPPLVEEKFQKRATAALYI